MCLSGCTPQGGSSSTTTAGCASCAYSGTGGTQVYSDEAVDVSTGTTLNQNGTATAHTDTIQVRVKCNSQPHVLQFINREIILPDGTRDSRTMRTTGGVYQTTTDPNNPVWNTDSAAKPNPYYEAGGASCNCPGELLIWDQPTLRPAAGETWNANFSAFIICDGKVIRRVDWTRSQTDGGSPSYTVNVSRASSLPQWAQDTLSNQGYTYP